MEFKNTATKSALENTPLTVHKLIVSISRRQISAWHGATAGVCLCLKTATSLSSLILWVSFSCIWTVNYLSLHPCSRVHLCDFFFFSFFSLWFIRSYQPLLFSVPDLSRGDCLSSSPLKGLCLQGLWWQCPPLPSLPAVQVITHGRVHCCVTLVTLCCQGKKTHECLDLSPSSKIKLCMSSSLFCPLTSLSWDPSWNTASRSQCRKDVDCWSESRAWIQRWQ